MSPTRAASLSRGVSYVFMLVATVAIVVGYVKLDNNQTALRNNQRALTAEIASRTVGQCKVITQVKNAAFSLTVLTPEAGVTDPNTLARIRLSNAAKLDARRKLAKALACPTH